MMGQINFLIKEVDNNKFWNPKQKNFQALSLAKRFTDEDEAWFEAIQLSSTYKKVLTVVPAVFPK